MVDKGEMEVWGRWAKKSGKGRRRGSKRSWGEPRYGRVGGTDATEGSFRVHSVYAAGIVYAIFVYS